MGREGPRIRPEFSALGIGKPTSPLLSLLIQNVFEIRILEALKPPAIAVDLGCGLLRNLRELKRHFPKLILVDTELQLTRDHEFGGKRMTVQDYVRRYYSGGGITVLTDREFATSKINSDVTFSINVMDVVPSRTRRSILTSMVEHLLSTGQFASLVPRNDSRTLELCRNARTYQDGHLFPNHGALTFYKNWPGHTLKALYHRFPIHVVRDLSRYRHSCLICMKTAK